MSTRSMVIIKISKEMQGKTINLILSGKWDNEINKSLINKNVTIEIPTNKKYMAIYVHYDGYTDGVGAEVNKIAYDRLKETMYKGDRSSLYNDDLESSLYINREETTNVRPHFFKTMKDAIQYAINSWCEYIYYKDINITYGCSVYYDCKTKYGKRKFYKIVTDFHFHKLEDNKLCGEEYLFE